MKKLLIASILLIGGFGLFLFTQRPGTVLSVVAPVATPVKVCWADTTTTTAIIDLTNVERVRAGLRPLVHDQRLDASAMLKAQDMIAHDYWAHVSPTGVQPWHWFDVVGYKYIAAAENLAQDFNTSNGVMIGWMNSKGHRDNLLSPKYEDIGVAVVCGQLLGKQTTLVVAEYAR